MNRGCAMEHKIPEYMLRPIDKSVISFGKGLAKINDPTNEIDYLAYVVMAFDKSIFGNNQNIDGFIEDTFSLLQGVEDYFDDKELVNIRKNLDYIKTHSYIFPKLVTINIANDYYLNKYGKVVNYLYLTNQQRTIIAKDILQELENNRFSIESLDMIKRKYGIKNNNIIFDMLYFIIYRDDLEALMVSCGIKPYTEIFPMTKNKNYAFTWRIRNYIKQIIETDNVEEVINKIIEERHQNNDKKIYYSDFIQHRMYKLAYYLLNDEEYQLFEERVEPYFCRRIKETQIAKREYIQSKKNEERNELMKNAILFLERYIQNKQGVEENELASQLAIIKKYDKEKYDDYIRKIYTEKAFDTILSFFRSKTKSLNEFLFQENINFFTFNKYRLLIDSQLNTEVKEGLRNACLDAYNHIKIVVELLLNNVKTDYDFAYASYILNKNFISEKTIISFIENAIKKEQIAIVKFNKLKMIQKNLKYYMDNRLKFNQGTDLFNRSIAVLKSYKGFQFSDSLKTQAIKYLLDNGSDVNYLTVRSILIRYALNKSFVYNEEKTNRR